MNARWLQALALTLCLATLTIGCIPTKKQLDVYQPLAEEPAGEIRQDRTIGQTFLSHYSGLCQIDVLLATYARQNTHLVTFHLRESPQSTTDLVTITFDAADVQDNAYRSFTFTPIPNSAERSYYFFFDSPTSTNGDAITAWATPQEVYSEGAFYKRNAAQSGDLAFRTYYSYSPIVLISVAARGLPRSVVPLLTGVLLLILPGWALLSLVGSELHPLSDKLVLICALSLSLYPVLLALCKVVGLHLSASWLWCLLAGSAIIIAWKEWSKRQQFSASRRKLQYQDALFLLLAFFVLLSRLLTAPELRIPLWADSYQHSVITQLIAENGGLFDSWEPYAPLRSFTYHFGFHAVTAFYQWLSGLRAPASVFWMAQAINALAVLSLYPLAVCLSNNRWAGLVAVAVAAWLSPMPAYYVNWGRYTQLAGQFILVVACWLTVEFLETPGRHAAQLALLGLLLAGLFFTHYRVTLFYLVFLVTYLLWETWRRRKNRFSVRELWLRTAMILLIALLLVASWGIPLALRYLPGLVQSYASGGSENPRAEGYNLLSNSLRWIPIAFSIPAFVGLIIGLWRKERGVILMAVWTVGLLLLANPNKLGLPGQGVVDNFAVTIALYIPGSIVIGNAIPWVERVSHRWPYTYPVLAIILVPAALLGVAHSPDIVDFSYQLVTPQDEAAMVWIRENTPPDAVFAVNTIFTYQGSLVSGSDAGWWIPLLARRRTTLPPQIYNIEDQPYPGYRQDLRTLTKLLLEEPLDAPETLSTLQKWGVTHVYVGLHRDQLPFGWARGGLTNERLLNTAHYRPLYLYDGVGVFKVVY